MHQLFILPAEVAAYFLRIKSDREKRHMYKICLRQKCNNLQSQYCVNYGEYLTPQMSFHSLDWTLQI